MTGASMTIAKAKQLWRLRTDGSRKTGIFRVRIQNHAKQEDTVMSLQTATIVCCAKAVNIVLKNTILLHVQVAPLDDGPTSRVSEMRSSVKDAARQENGPTKPALLTMLNAKGVAPQDNGRSRLD